MHDTGGRPEQVHFFRGGDPPTRKKTALDQLVDHSGITERRGEIQPQKVQTIHRIADNSVGSKNRVIHEINLRNHLPRTSPNADRREHQK